MKQLLLFTLGISLTLCAMDNPQVDNAVRVKQAVSNLVSAMQDTVQPHYDTFMQHPKTTQAVDKLESGFKWLAQAEKNNQTATKAVSAVTALFVAWYTWRFIFGGAEINDPYTAALMPISAQQFSTARDNSSEKTVTINVYAAPANT